MTRAALGALASLALGCGPAATLSTDRGAYSAGDAIWLTLSNTGSPAIFFDLCAPTLKGPSGETTLSPVDPDCSANFFSIPSRGEALTLLALPAGLAPGDYRCSAQFEPSDQFGRPGTPMTATSGTFRVR